MTYRSVSRPFRRVEEYASNEPELDQHGSVFRVHDLPSVISDTRPSSVLSLKN